MFNEWCRDHDRKLVARTEIHKLEQVRACLLAHGGKPPVPDDVLEDLKAQF